MVDATQYTSKEKLLCFDTAGFQITKNPRCRNVGARAILLDMLAKIKNKTTDVVMDALIKQAKKLPEELYKSLTLDRGSEFAAHKILTIAIGIEIHFCDPQSS